VLAAFAASTITVAGLQQLLEHNLTAGKFIAYAVLQSKKLSQHVQQLQQLQ
jgi:hypothetical protein